MDVLWDPEIQYTLIQQLDNVPLELGCQLRLNQQCCIILEIRTIMGSHSQLYLLLPLPLHLLSDIPMIMITLFVVTMILGSLVRTKILALVIQTVPTVKLASILLDSMLAVATHLNKYQYVLPIQRPITLIGKFVHIQF